MIDSPLKWPCQLGGTALCQRLAAMVRPPLSALLSLGLVLLCQAPASVTCHTRGRDSSSSSRLRTHRSVHSPDPINCVLGPWSAWTPCPPCESEQHRHRRLQQPAKYKGQSCMGTRWDTAACPGLPCNPVNLCGEKFMCEESGRCIDRQMVCNREEDCQDGSDERDCLYEEEEEDDSFCQSLFPIPGVEQLVLGYNALTQEFQFGVLDPKYSGGLCEYVYNGDWRQLSYEPFCERMYYSDDEKYFRKPHNLHSYSFQAQASNGMSTEYYDNVNELLRALGNENSNQFGFSFGIANVELGFSFQNSEKTLKNVTDYLEQNVGFIRMQTRVETAQFTMRSQDLVLDETMLQSLHRLPEDYDPGQYLHFINTYGTHYVTAGTLGGVYEHIVVVDAEAMKHEEVDFKEVGFCFGVKLQVPLEKSGKVNIGVGTNICDTQSGSLTEKGKKSKVIKDILNRVRGGNLAQSSSVTARSAEAFREWGHSLAYSPALIEFQILPIYELLRFTNVNSIEKKTTNLRQAWDEYLAENNPCRCGPCQNNGEPLLQGTTCKCVCPSGSSGEACEETDRKGPTHGAWSCWSQWSGCLSGMRTRSRQCNNPAPSNGGQNCVGRNGQMRSC
uniref:Complement C8 alpha chain n=1 Tax=Erpetoichthys calabaricus TaxID=27687 RepID=A0A8C4XEQ7_ERPCA